MASLYEYTSGRTLIEFGTLLAEAAIALVLAPELLKHFASVREREARIALNIEIVDPKKNTQPVYGLDPITSGLHDFIDRARNPRAYAELDAGNEILIVGPEQAGKKALALHIAQLADIGRVVIVYNPRDADVLARAKSMIENRPSLWRRIVRSFALHEDLPRSQKTMLLLPGLDPANGNKGEAWCDQLEALIETASSLPHVLIVGTAATYERKGEVASWFGTVLPLPEEGSAGWDDMIKQIADGFLEAALKAKYRLADDFQSHDFIERILRGRPNPAEVKDIFAHCKTLATYKQRKDRGAQLLFTPEILATAIKRVIPPG